MKNDTKKLDKKSLDEKVWNNQESRVVAIIALLIVPSERIISIHLIMFFLHITCNKVNISHAYRKKRISLSINDWLMWSCVQNFEVNKICKDKKNVPRKPTTPTLKTNTSNSSIKPTLYFFLNSTQPHLFARKKKCQRAKAKVWITLNWPCPSCVRSTLTPKNENPFAPDCSPPTIVLAQPVRKSKRGVRHAMHCGW